MKVGFIFVLYKTPKKEQERLKREISKIKFKNKKIYFIDNTFNNQGYAYGVNQGIKKGLKDNCDVFVVANPDISFKKNINNIFDGLTHFDIYGFSMIQEGKIYYGGKIDPWRFSGGLIKCEPKTRFINIDFVSGSLMVIKKKVIDKIGYFDESYFLYYEEVDFCYRAKKEGFKIGIDKNVLYEHFEVSKTNNPQKENLLFKNRLKFFLKYANFWQKIREFIRLPKTLFEEIKKRRFYFNFFSLNLSSIINKFLNFLLFIFFIRYLKPEEYAVYTLAWNHIGLFLPILDFGTTSYGLVFEEKNNKRNLNNLFSLRIFLGLITLILSLLALVFLKYQKDVVQGIFLISIVYLANSFSGTYLIITSLKEKNYLSSFYNLIFQTILVFSSIVVFLFEKKIKFIFYLVFFFYLSYLFFNLYLLTKNEKLKITLKINWEKWLAILQKSYIFLMISFLARAYSKVDILMLNFLKGEKAVGLYSAGYKFLDALMFVVVAYNLSSIPLYSQLAREKKYLKLKEKIKKDLVFLFLIGFFISVFFLFFSPIILKIFMKEHYLSSINVARIVVFSLPLILMTSVFLNSLYALKKIKIIIFIFLFQLIYNVVFNYLFIPSYSYFASSWISVFGELINLFLTYFAFKKSYENLS